MNASAFLRTAAILSLLAAQAGAADTDRVVAFTRETEGREINRYYSLHAHGPTKKFYTFADQRIVVVVHVDPAGKDAIGTSAVVHLFAADADATGIDKWINNQHSDAIYPEVPAPRREVKIDPGRIHAKATGPLEHEVGGNGDEYDRYRVDFTIDGFTDGDLTVKPSQGTAEAFVRTREPGRTAPARE